MITSKSQKGKREKVNFMVDQTILIKFKEFVPAGERSDFVNASLKEALQTVARQKAFDAMDEFRKKAKIRMSTKEFIRLKNYGRP